MTPSRKMTCSVTSAIDLCSMNARATTMPTSDDFLTIPIPIVRPLNLPLDKAEYVQEVWDAFVKPEQEAEIPPSAEMRLLMAILRAVYKGLVERDHNVSADR